LRPRPAIILFLVASAAGLLFAAVSTYDFIQHLDRQLHGIHCSFIPGLGALDASGSSGCSAALMSPYSSVLRSVIWGGIPVSLAGMAVFAFLFYRGAAIIVTREQGSKTTTLLLVLIAAIPVLTSVVMGVIAIVELGELCKMCVGIYISSFVALGAAVWAWMSAGRPSSALDDDLADDPEDDDLADAVASPAIPFLVAGAEAAAFVIVPLAVYALMVPDYSTFVGSCGELVRVDDPYDVLVPLDGNAGTPVIEVMDPLCPACRGFERRFSASGLSEKVHRKALLFPLDDTCNWMVNSALHPGACDVSAAVLCADGRAPEVLDWAFENQDELRAAAATDPEGPKMMVSVAFPELSDCLGSARARSELNRSMRWAVSNQLPVMMPQVFVDGVKLCDEDTDLGLDYALGRMLDGAPVAAVSGGGEGGRVEVGR